MNLEHLTINLKNMYVAHQNTSSLDEIQRMAVGYLNNHPVALEGSPGSGKNHAISTLASAIKKKEYRIRCTEEMMARDVIGGEKLDVEKSVGGYIVALSQDGVTCPLKFVKKSRFSEDEVNPTSFEQIDLAVLNDGLQNYLRTQAITIKQNKDRALAMHKQDNPRLFNFSEDGSVSNWYNF